MNARRKFPPWDGWCFFPCDISELQALVRSRNCLPVLVSLPFLDKSHFYQVTSHKRFRSKKEESSGGGGGEAIAKEMERIVPEAGAASSFAPSVFRFPPGSGDSWNLFTSKERLRNRDVRGYTRSNTEKRSRNAFACTASLPISRVHKRRYAGKSSDTFFRL